MALLEEIIVNTQGYFTYLLDGTKFRQKCTNELFFFFFTAFQYYLSYY